MNLTHTTFVQRSAPLELPTVCAVASGADVCEALGSMSSSALWQLEHYDSAEAFLAGSRATTPTCVLTELRLPGLSGLDLQREILHRPELPLIFVSTDPDVHSTVQAMKHGAFDFLTKPCSKNVLLETVRDALEHSRIALRQLARTHSLQERYESLSRREREVMHLVVAGRLNKQVGTDLGISEITVKAHRGKLMRKMQAISFAHLVNMAASLRA